MILKNAQSFKNTGAMQVFLMNRQGKALRQGYFDKIIFFTIDWFPDSNLEKYVPEGSAEPSNTT
jgi:hypothetical protein